MTFEKYAMPKMCDNCPFAKRGKGAALRRSLARGRMDEIKRGLSRGGHFFCHKTTTASGFTEDDEAYFTRGQELVCAGAIAWQAKRGIVADAIQIVERLKAIKESA